jgi:ribosomal protein L37E
MSADPSPEVVAAALALAEAASECVKPPNLEPGAPYRRLCTALAAYRASIATTLRTRAEVDAEIVATVRTWFANSGGRPVGMGDGTVRALELSCREQTAPEPSPPPESYECPKCGPIGRDVTDDGECKRCGRNAYIVGTQECADACGCEASDELRDTVKELRRLLKSIHGFGKSIVELSEEVP